MGNQIRTTILLAVMTALMSVHISGVMSGCSGGVSGIMFRSPCVLRFECGGAPDLSAHSLPIHHKHELMSTTSSGRFYRFCGVDGILRLNYKTHGCVDSTNQPNQA
mgnify:CR=1 FL=1